MIPFLFRWTGHNKPKLARWNKPLLLFIWLLGTYNGVAQVSTKTNLNDDRFKGIIYRKETTADLRLHNNGLALAINFGEIRTYYRTNYYHFELGTMHSPREHKQSKNLNVIGNELPKEFKLGKQNSVFILRAGKGIKRYISDKARRKGVSLGYSIEGGPSLALLKPTYLKFIEQVVVNGELESILVDKKYSAENRDEFIDYGSIYGGSSFSTGLKEISILPGFQAKAGLFFSVGAFDEYVKAAEAGVMVDVFIKKVPIMVETEGLRNSPFFVNLYVNLHFGRRSN